MANTITHSIDDYVFDLACRGEVRLMLQSDFDERSMPVWTATMDRLYFGKVVWSVESDQQDSADDAVRDVVQRYEAQEAS